MKKQLLLVTLLMAMFAPLTMNGQQTANVVSGGTGTNQYIPMYNYYNDYGFRSEYIIPASYFTSAGLTNGDKLKSITLYRSATGSWASSTMTIQLTNTSTSSYSSNAFLGKTGTTVYSTSSYNGGTSSSYTFNFTSDFEYTGGSLVVHIYATSGGTCSSSSSASTWSGYSSTDNQAVYSSGSSSANATSGTVQKFIPNTTFTYERATSDPYISLSHTSATVLTGFTTTLTATTHNVTGTPTITYSSSNTSVATVSGSGTSATVTAVSAGTATITATMTYNSNTYTAQCAITVEDPSYCNPSFSSPSDDYISNFTTTGGDSNINNSSTYVSGGYSDYYNSYSALIEQGGTLTCSVTPSSTSWSYGHAIWVDWNKDYTFGSDEKVAYTSSTATGVWTANFTVPATTAPGDYRLRVIHYYNNTPTDPCMSASYGEAEDYKLTVFAASTDPSITLSPATATVLIGNTETLTAIVRNVTNPTITYTSSNTSVATVSGNGTTATVTGVAAGTATITASMTVSGTTYNATSTINVQLDPCTKVIPYTYGFEDATDYNDCWTNDNLEECSSNSNMGGGVYNSSNYANNGSKLFIFSSYCGETDPQYLVSPQLSGVANGVHVEFYYAIADFAQGAPETFKVGYSTTNNNVSSFTWSEEITCTSSTYEHYSANFMGQVKYIAVQYTSADSYYLFLDDFLIEEAPNCLEPTNVLASNETTTSATISWTAGGSETEWDIYFTTNPSDVPTASTTPSFSGLTTNSFNTVTNNYTLTPASTYYVYVRSACSSTETSAWSTPGIFNTECYTMSLPYSETFEAGDLTVCWTSIIESPVYMSISVDNANPYAGTYHLNLDRRTPNGTQIIVLPEVDAAYALSDAEVSFYAMLSSGGSSSYTSDGRTLTIGVMTDPDDESTFVAVGSAVEPTSSYAKYTFDLSSYTGNGQYIAIKHDETSSGHNGYTYIDNLEVTVNAYTKVIEGYGTSDGGYYLIASPIGDIDPTAVTDMTTNGKFDLYRFNQAAAVNNGISYEWENWKKEGSDHYHFDLESGKGYLYANKEGTTLKFTGTAHTGTGENGSESITLSVVESPSSDKVKGLNLIGNPFGTPATLNKAYYRMQNAGELITGNGTVAAMEGVFVVASTDGETVTFTPGTGSKADEQLILNVTQGRSNIDRAIVRFGNKDQLPKIQLFGNSTKVYIPQGTDDFAVVSAEAQGEMPVNFEATSNGTYTLSVNAENVEFNYLHLIDNMTGAEVDLLETPSYSFNATTSDYSSRFKLVFAQGNNSNSDEFAFISNGNIIVNGEGMLQVIDMTGRIISTSQINGVSSLNLNAAAGVYVLQLTNGENVKTQKIVVK